MKNVINLGNWFLGKNSKVVTMGYRLVEDGKPCKSGIWQNVGIAIEAAKYRAAESAGVKAVSIPYGLSSSMAVPTHTSRVGVERVEMIDGDYHYVGIALVEYTLGSYFPRVNMLPVITPPLVRPQAPSTQPFHVMS